MITIGLGTAIILFVVWFIIAYGCYAGSVGRYKDAIKAPHYPILHNSAKKQSGEIRLFIHRIESFRRKGDVSRVDDGKEFKYYFEKSDNPMIAEFIRWAHKLGCEVVIRQVSDQDIEAEENRGDAFWEYLGDRTENHYNKWIKEFKRKFKD